jgi:hypothetical protein
LHILITHSNRTWSRLTPCVPISNNPDASICMEKLSYDPAANSWQLLRGAISAQALTEIFCGNGRFGTDWNDELHCCDRRSLTKFFELISTVGTYDSRNRCEIPPSP